MTANVNTKTYLVNLANSYREDATKEEDTNTQKHLSAKAAVSDYLAKIVNNSIVTIDQAELGKVTIDAAFKNDTPLPNDDGEISLLVMLIATYFNSCKT